MICDQWDVVVVPFPFSDRPQSKRRPALVLSGGAFNRAGHTVLSMITSVGHRPWPGDTPVKGHERAGLRAACMVRLKLFTLDNRLLLRRLGALGGRDRERVCRQMRQHLP